MADTIEIAAKSEHVKNLRSEIDRLESDKAKFQDWFRAKEKEADALSLRMSRLREANIEERNALDKQSAQIKADRILIENAKNRLASEETGISNRLSNIAIQEQALKERSQSITDKELELGEREAQVKKRESWIKAMFEQLEALKK